ncbi:hypothetical protein FMUND_2824 [Fusarium mundagurra]|uniref:Uncharacterized protein n=1 Tax=Fusarium mundagurra TaxID=1567541 RepID=A0A8H5Z119_9HYPO|nr:hypothetical protein FMUND_2824 [Fusarium mundagurra]
MRLTYLFVQFFALYKLTSASPCKPSSQSPNSITSIGTSSSGDAETTGIDILSTTSITTESATITGLSSSILSAETESATSTGVPSSSSARETESSTIIASSETTTIAESTTSYESLVSATSAATSAVASVETSTDETPTTTTSVKQQPTNLIRNPGFEDPTFAPWEAEKIGNRGWLSIRSDTSRPGSLQCGVFDSSVPPTGGLRRRLIQPWNWIVKQNIDPSEIIVGKEYRFSIF